uniref:Uncharacterized protein n=1 Tax=Anas platyrhynchos platyrhynchos TaxID=8840 RepID=A0A493TQD1_ANAPP
PLPPYTQCTLASFLFFPLVYQLFTNYTCTALLLAAGYAIFMHPSAREHPNALSAWRCGALLGYFPAWVSFPLALSSGQVWSAIWRWEQAPWMVAVSPHPVLPPAFASPRDARGGHQRWISLCHLPLQAH